MAEWICLCFCYRECVYECDFSFSIQVNSIEYTVHVGTDMWSHVVIAAPKATTFWTRLSVTSSVSGQRYQVFRPEPSDMLFRERSLWSVYLFGLVDPRDEGAGLRELTGAVKAYNPGTYVTCLGLRYNTKSYLISIAPDKMPFLTKKMCYFSYFTTKTYVVGTHLKCLTESLLMSTHNICFHGEIRKIFT